jgi:glycerol uptake facilitator-like aquaporin
VYSLSHLPFFLPQLSSAHINPAVTFALVITNNCGLLRGIWYIICQLIGAIMGASLVYGCVGSPLNQGALGSNGLAPGVSIGQAILWETVGTFILVFTVLQTAYLGSDPMAKVCLPFEQVEVFLCVCVCVYVCVCACVCVCVCVCLSVSLLV